MTGRNPSYSENAARDVLLPVKRLGYLVSLVMGSHATDDPRASPFQAGFPGCPPLLLFASEVETPRDDTVLLARRLIQEGVRVDLVLEPDCPHAWPVFARLPEAVQSIRHAAAFARAVLGLTPLPEGSGDS
jgi:acetyl esterase/lipase